MSDTNDKYRPELKSYFLAYSIPTQTNFEDLIDAMVIQGEDPIAAPYGSPLQIRKVGNAQVRDEFIYFCEDFNVPDPWILGQNLNTKSLEIATDAATRLSIGKDNGWVGVNTPVSRAQLDVSVAITTISPLMIGSGAANYLSISNQEENSRIVIGGDIPGDYTEKAKLHVTLGDQDITDQVNPLVIERQSGNGYFFINSNSQVGINTDIEANDPEEVKLSVNGDIRAGTSDNSIYLQNAGNDDAPTLYATGEYNRLKIISSGDMALWASGDPSSAINDSNALYLKESGRVGIGTETPETTLEVAGDIKTGGSSARPIYLKNATSGGAPTLLSPATDKWLRVMVGKDISFWAGNPNEGSPGTSHLFIQSDGNIGIGTDSPVSKLEVNGHIKAGTGDTILLKNASEDPVLFSPSESKPLKVVAGQDIAFWAGNSNEDVSGVSHLSIKNDGKVGIGIDNPTDESLEIDGKFKADFLTANIDASCIVSGIINPALLFPKLTIIMWYGDQGSIPKGWAICDGNPHGTITTPDLRGFFIVGASTSGSGDYSLGSTGGEETHALTELEMPSHSHGVTDPGHTHSYEGADNHSGDDGGSDSTYDDYTSQTGANKTGITLDYTGGNDGGETDPHENRPPFKAVYYIMKIVGEEE